MSKLTRNKQKTLIIRKPRVTEKSSKGSESRTYTFEVSFQANKKEIAQAIKESYGVSPIKVAIIRIPTKTITRKAGHGKTRRGKKAVVYLKEGDKIEFV